ncbi:MAG: NUDIX domain-containing protein [Dysgonamonadaceae bacterium]|jgi:isopentenyl-diphosphate delta-isomerase type 1|nr:NUDIX domain-containing protein [Dysgonamonadaceae bacterium]
MEEIFPLVDESGKVIGQATRSKCHNGSKMLHPVVHLYVFNGRGELLLQKRAANKDIQPGKWDTSVGGHVNSGESVEDALYREAKEELGMENFTPEFIQSTIFESDIEKEFVYSYKTVYDRPFEVEKTEIDTVHFWDSSEIEYCLGKSIFTPAFEREWKMRIAQLAHFHAR